MRDDGDTVFHDATDLAVFSTMYHTLADGGSLRQVKQTADVGGQCVDDLYDRCSDAGYFAHNGKRGRGSAYTVSDDAAAIAAVYDEAVDGKDGERAFAAMVAAMGEHDAVRPAADIVDIGYRTLSSRAAAIEETPLLRTEGKRRAKEYTVTDTLTAMATAAAADMPPIDLTDRGTPAAVSPTVQVDDPDAYVADLFDVDVADAVRPDPATGDMDRNAGRGAELHNKFRSLFEGEEEVIEQEERGPVFFDGEDPDGMPAGDEDYGVERRMG